MFIRIEKGSRVPISRQIAEQIRAMCATGSLQASEKMPSVRQLASELAVNQNTILRVYDRLVGEGVLVTRQGEGTFVADGAKKRRLGQQKRQFEDELRRIARQGLMLGCSPKQLHRMLEQAVEDLEPELRQETRKGVS